MLSSDCSRKEPGFLAGITICVPGYPAWNQRVTAMWGLFFVRSGKGVVSCNQQSLTAGAGTLVLMTPGARHRFVPEEGWELLWFHFHPRPHIIGMLQWPPSIPGTAAVQCSGQECKKISNALMECCELELHRPSGWDPLAMQLLESVIVRGFNRIQSYAEPDSTVRLVQELLITTVDSVERIAARCGISRAKLYAEFRRETGLSPRQYRESAMLRRAARLLEQSGLPVSEIAEQSGMPDPYYFSTRFRKYFGVSPREYRRRAIITGGHG